jgi:periplasmic divalent cation tolerance protein
VPRPALQLVLTTCPDADTAERIAETLVGEHLAACVNILPIAKSVYRWRGKVETAAELLLIIKAPVRGYRALQRRLLELHPYELPEVVSVPIVGGFADYLTWINNPEKS